MFFRRIVAFITLLASFALLSHARPTHHARALGARTDAVEFVSRLKTFQSEVGTCSADLTEVASTDGNPEAQVKKLVSAFDAMTTYLGQVSVKLSSEQETECAGIVSDILVKATTASHQVGAKARFMKWYALWTEQDVSVHAFLWGLSSISYNILQLSVKSAGTAVCGMLHDMRMMLVVNIFRGMGIGY